MALTGLTGTSADYVRYQLSGLALDTGGVFLLLQDAETVRRACRHLRSVPVLLEHEPTKVVGKVVNAYYKPRMGIQITIEIDADPHSRKSRYAREAVRLLHAKDATKLKGFSLGLHMTKEEFLQSRNVETIKEISLVCNPYFKNALIAEVWKAHSEANTQLPVGVVL